MTDPDQDTPNELVRTQEFDVPGPVELDLSNSIGPVRIELDDTDTALVEIRHEPSAGPPDWRSGLSGLLTWVGEQIAESGIRTGNGRESREAGRESREATARTTEAHAEAVRQTRVDMTGTRLAIHPPKTVPLRTVPLSITVRLPRHSQLGVRTGSGAVTVTGSAGRTDIQTGSGAVTAEAATGNVSVRTGSGQLRLGEMHAVVQARSGSGGVEIASVHEPSSVITGSGNVWLGAVESDLLVRSGSGDVSISEAASGRSELITGSGEIRIAIRKGATAEVDLTSSTGTASSDLTVSEQAPESEPELRIFGRTGSGQALVTSAV